MDAVSPLSITESIFPRVVVLLDSSILTSSSIFAVHANSSKETLFLGGKDIQAYLKKFETDEIKVQEIDFAVLATAPPAAAAQASKPPVKEKEDAKIEGAVQIAIGVKKEVDFSTWYTNVRFPRSTHHSIMSKINLQGVD